MNAFVNQNHYHITRGCCKFLFLPISLPHIFSLWYIILSPRLRLEKQRNPKPKWELQVCSEQWLIWQQQDKTLAGLQSIDYHGFGRINFINFNKINRFANYTNLIGPPLTRKTLGAFHSTQNSGNFGSGYIKWNGPFRFDPTGIFEDRFEVVDFDRSFRSIRPKFPFPFVI